MSQYLNDYFQELAAGVKRRTGNSTLAIAAVKAIPGLNLVRADHLDARTIERDHPELKGRVLTLSDVRARRAIGPLILDAEVLYVFAGMAAQARQESMDREAALKAQLEAALRKELEAQLQAALRAEHEATQFWGLDDDQRTAEEEDLAHQVEQLQAQVAELQKDLDLSQQRHVRVSRALDAMRKIGMDMAINPAQMLRALIDVQK